MPVDHDELDVRVVNEEPPVPRAGKRISIGMLLLGAGLLWSVPLGGALFLVTGGLGVAIASESELT